MKFLIALSVLASSTVFAEGLDRDRWIKCYEQAQQGEHAELEYKLKAKDGYLWLVKPFEAQMALNNDGCLETTYTPDTTFDGRHLELCRGEGQHINGYIPVEAQEGYDDQQEEETVYCEKEIKKWFYTRPASF